jgi:hypothetical protein
VSWPHSRSASGAGNRTPVTRLPELTWLVTMGIDGSFSRNHEAGAFERLKLFTKYRYEWGFSSKISPTSRHLALLNLMPYTRYCKHHDTYITNHLYIWLLFIYFDLANKTRFQNLVGSMLERGIPEYICKKENRRYQIFSKRNAM